MGCKGRALNFETQSIDLSDEVIDELTDLENDH